MNIEIEHKKIINIIADINDMYSEQFCPFIEEADVMISTFVIDETERVTKKIKFIQSVFEKDLIIMNPNEYLSYVTEIIKSTVNPYLLK